MEAYAAVNLGNKRLYISLLKNHRWKATTTIKRARLALNKLTIFHRYIRVYMSALKNVSVLRLRYVLKRFATRINTV